jgi:hypothetical protein
MSVFEADRDRMEAVHPNFAPKAVSDVHSVNALEQSKEAA